MPPHDDLLIRTATESDVTAIAKIYAHYVLHDTATFEIEPPACAEMERRRSDVLQYGLPFLVAEKDGRILGYAYAGRYRPRPAYRFTVEDSVYIRPDLRGQGLGRILLARLIDLCSQAGCRQMIAVIGDSGNAASIRLHEKLGFRNVGVLEGTGRKFGRWIDTVLMQRALDTGHGFSEVKAIIDRGLPRGEALGCLAEYLRRHRNHRWVGVYEVDHASGQVRNLVFAGPGAPAYPNFSINQGLTGIAVRERRTINIGDVSADAHYLTAFGTTRSEIIVPIFDSDQRNSVVGTIDIESENLNAFSYNEQVFLEDCAEILRLLWTRT